MGACSGVRATLTGRLMGYTATGMSVLGTGALRWNTTVVTFAVAHMAAADPAARLWSAGFHCHPWMLLTLPV